MKYGPFVESVKKRGLNLSEVVCSGFTVGWYGEVVKSRRTLRIECFMKNGTANIYVRPINGIIILAGIDEMKIIEYHDGTVEPVPKAENTEYRASHMEPPFSPKLQSYVFINQMGQDSRSKATVSGNIFTYVTQYIMFGFPPLMHL